jgi:hypothetical protein
MADYGPVHADQGGGNDQAIGKRRMASQADHWFAQALLSSGQTRSGHRGWTFERYVETEEEASILKQAGLGRENP